MTNPDKIVAVSLLTEQELSVLEQGLKRIYPMDDEALFVDLLRAIDHADEERIAIQSGSGEQRLRS